jgi:hypothetical protein
MRKEAMTDIQEGLTYRLYVPTADARHHIDAGSAIVGEIKEGLAEVHFERGGASNVQTFEEKIHHAAGRRAASYPTIARGAFPAEGMKDVGSVRYDAIMRRWVIDEILDEASLKAWAPGSHVEGGSAKLKDEATGWLSSRLNSSGLMDVSMQVARGVPLSEAILATATLPGRMR